MVRKNQRNTVRETKRYAGHTDKVSGLNELKNLATREKLEVWGINSTLGNYQMAVYLWNSENIVMYKIASGQLNKHVPGNMSALDRKHPGLCIR